MIPLINITTNIWRGSCLICYLQPDNCTWNFQSCHGVCSGRLHQGILQWRTVVVMDAHFVALLIQHILSVLTYCFICIISALLNFEFDCWPPCSSMPHGSQGADKYEHGAQVCILLQSVHSRHPLTSSKEVAAVNHLYTLVQMYIPNLLVVTFIPTPAAL